MKIKIDPNSLVVMVGAMGTGKSTLCKASFAHHHIVSTDDIRDQLTGNFTDQTYNSAVFEILNATLETRVKNGLLTVVDSTGSRSVIQKCSELAKKYRRPLIAIQLPELNEGDINVDRMQHRMHCLDAYRNQVERINTMEYPDNYQVYKLNHDDVVDISFSKVGGSIELDPKFKYVIIPDLHGEVSILKHMIHRYDTDNTKYIFLGDIVDRGESSYKTFRMVQDIVKRGDGFIVKGNHDKKLAEYFVKWKENPIYTAAGGPPTYGKTIRNGLETTVKEFFTLSEKEMHSYANDFIEFYKNAYYFLKLKKKNMVHFFAHARVNSHLVMGLSPRKCDESCVVYKGIEDATELTEIFRNFENIPVILHVGHVFDQYSFYHMRNPNDINQHIIMHDVGFGKHSYVVPTLPELLMV